MELSFSSAGSISAPLITPRSASSFSNSVGIGTHIDAGSLQWGNTEIILTELNYIGVNSVRDGTPYDFSLPIFVSLAKAGIRFDLAEANVYSRNQVGQVDAAHDVARAHQLEAAVPGSVLSLEGTNEYTSNSYVLDGVTSYGNLAWGLSDVSQLQAAARSDPLFTNTTIIASSAIELESLPDFGPYVDGANAHVYGFAGEQLQDRIVGSVHFAQASAPGKSVFITEVGISSSGYGSSDWGVTDEDTQAIINVNAVLDGYAAGATKTFLYELMDEPNAVNAREQHFGLFRPDGTPKPSAIALSNLMHIMADDGRGNVQSGALAYNLSGVPASASSMLLEKSDGTFDIIVWNGRAQLSDGATAIAPTSSTTSLDLDTTAFAVELYDPMESDDPISTLSGSSTVTFQLSRDPVIIQLTPSPSLAAEPTKFGTVMTDPHSTEGSVAQPQLTSGPASLITDATDAAVARLYYGLLDRAPDAAGLQSWAAAAHNDSSISAVAQGFLNSGEYDSHHIGETDQQFVDHLYIAALGRAADPAGEQSWLYAISHGSSRADVAVGIIESPEAQQHLAAQIGSIAQPQLTSGPASLITDATDAAVARLYYGLLDRAPDAAGLQSWAAAAHNDSSISAVAQGFLNSGEYDSHHIGETDQQFVDHLYIAALGRAADPAGEQSWLYAISHGSSRADVAVGIIESPEAQQHLAAQIGQDWHLA